MVKPFHLKRLLARAFDAAFLNALLHRCQVKWLSPFIRAVYYHDVPPSEAQRFEQQLAYYVEHFSTVGYNELIEFQHNRWTSAKPGLILTFDDGHRSCSEVIAPLLDKYGLVGWFFVPPGLLNVPPEDQANQAMQHRLAGKSMEYDSPRVFLTWDQVCELDRNHIVGCHTLSHRRMHPRLSDSELNREIVTSKQILEEQLNHEVISFAWVGGEESSYCPRAAKLIRDANYKIVFLTNSCPIRPDTDLHFLNRTHMDSAFSGDLMRFQLSGFVDALYASRRKRVAALLASSDATT